MHQRHAFRAQQAHDTARRHSPHRGGHSQSDQQRERDPVSERVDLQDTVQREVLCVRESRHIPNEQRETHPPDTLECHVPQGLVVHIPVDRR